MMSAFQVGEWDVAHDEYHADRTADSSSTIKDYLRSPELYYRTYIKPTSQPLPPPSAAMTFGTAFHCAILEPDRYAEEYVTPPEDFHNPETGEREPWNRRKKEHKAAWVEWEESSKGKTIISSADRDKITAMSTQLSRDNAAVELMGMPGLKVEQAIRFEWRGLKIKCMFDLVWPDAGIHCNLKTSREWGRDTSAEDTTGVIGREIFKRGYHIAQALYNIGFQKVYGSIPVAKFLWCHNSPPWECGLFTLGPKSLAAGEEIAARIVDEILAAKELDWWHSSIHGEDTVVEIPAYGLRKKEWSRH